MNTTVTLDIVQTVIYAGVAIAGYFVSHSGILKRLTGGASPSPAPVQPPLPGVQPALSNILKVVEDQLLEVLTDAVKRMVQPPAAGAEQGVQAKK